MRSATQHQFSQVPSVNIQRSSFKRDNALKTTFDFSYLVPVYWDEALPGDTHTVRMNGFGRIATPIHPVMDNAYLETFFFAVPVRLLWDNWEKFNGAQDNPGDSTDYLVPTMQAPATTGYAENSISDYLGLPTKVPDYNHITFYHRAYNRIYNDWFRDQNLQDSVIERTGDAGDLDTDYVLLRRGKRHDYFTSSLPWPAKTQTPVLLPLGDQAPINVDGAVGDDVSAFFTDVSLSRKFDAGNPFLRGSGTAGTNDMYADLTNATAATINDLREAFQIQRMYEKDARGGTRYVETLKAHFQVVSPDFRLQRAEYLGGGSSMINIHPVTQTSESGTQPQGSMAAFGTVAMTGHGFTKSFTEHCVILGLANARCDLTYQQGLDRHFSRSTRFDYFWPSLANLGEQAVLNQEIFTQSDKTINETPWGYQERWAEYRYKPNRITGLFRSNATQTLDPWHYAQDFAALPPLNTSFIEDDPPVDRTIAVHGQPHIIFDAYFNVTSARPMPVNSVPGLIDHF